MRNSKGWNLCVDAGKIKKNLLNLGIFFSIFRPYRQIVNKM